MSTVGDSIARATAAGIRAAQLAPFVHCEPLMRNPIRSDLARQDSRAARDLRNELERKWAAMDSGRPAWRVR